MPSAFSQLITAEFAPGSKEEEVSQNIANEQLAYSTERRDAFADGLLYGPLTVEMWQQAAAAMNFPSAMLAPAAERESRGAT